MDPVLLEAICRRAGIRFHASLLRPLGQWLSSRLQVIGLASVADYFAWLADPVHLAAERPALSSVTSSRETFFLRDHGQIELLRDQVLPELISRNSGRKQLKIWSVGCSTGEEPYTLAMLAREAGLLASEWRLEITGFDIDAEALHQASRGIYRDWSFRGCPDEFRHRYFEKTAEGWRIEPSLRQQVQFRPLDLLAPPGDLAAQLPIDLILCRNVFIYFDHTAIDQALDWLLRCLADGGYLFCAPGELASHPRPELSVCAFPEAIVYRKGISDKAPVLQPVLKPQSLLVEPVRALQPRASFSAKGVREVPRHVDVKPVSGLNPAATPVPILANAWQAANRGLLDESAMLCAKIREQAPLDPDAYYLSAILSLARGELSVARDELRRVLYLAPDYLLAYPMLAELCLNVEDVSAASRYARQGLARALALQIDTPLSPYSSNCVGDVRAHLEQLASKAADATMHAPAE